MIQRDTLPRMRAEGGPAAGCGGTDAVSLRACRRTDRPGYVDEGAVVDSYSTATPFPLTIDLAAIGNLLR